LKIELRENHPEGTLIDTKIFDVEDVPSSWSWYEVDFTDTILTTDSDYFIVIPPAPSGASNGFGYEWGYSYGPSYDNGSFWFTRDGGELWRPLPTRYDFTIRVYGI
jgi:hypothetical protein